MNLKTDVALFDLVVAEAEHIRRDRATELERAKKVSLKERKDLAQKMVAEEREANKKEEKKARKRSKDEFEEDFGNDNDDEEIEEDEANDIRTRDKLRNDEWEEAVDLVDVVFQPRKESKREVKRSWKLKEEDSAPNGAVKRKKITTKRVVKGNYFDFEFYFSFQLFLHFRSCLKFGSSAVEAVEKRRKIQGDNKRAVKEIAKLKEIDLHSLSTERAHLSQCGGRIC